MTRKEKLAWAAGIVDGEGYIRFKRGKYRSGNVAYLLQVSVTNTDIRMLEALQKLFRGVIYQSAVSDDTKMDCWTWTASHGGAEKVLRAIRPFLVVKKEQADLALLSRKHTIRGPKSRGSEFMEANVDEMSRLKREPGTHLRMIEI